MSRTIAEAKALKKLGIPDWRHLTKDKVVELNSMIDKLEPEVAKKAIEQFPNFSSTMKDMVRDSKEVVSTAIEQSSESTREAFDGYKRTLDILEKELENEDLTFDQRKWIIEKHCEIVQNMDKLDTKNKNYLLAFAGIVAITAITVGSVLSSALGVAAILAPSTDQKELLEDDYEEYDDDDDI